MRVTAAACSIKHEGGNDQGLWGAIEALHVQQDAGLSHVDSPLWALQKALRVMLWSHTLTTSETVQCG